MSIHVTECYSVLKEKEAPASTVTWMAVKTLWGLGRISQLQEDHTDVKPRVSCQSLGNRKWIGADAGF